MNRKTVVLYHGGCPDGFGGAWAAWKKFGDKAHYSPQKDRKTAPQDIDGAEVYLIDFCFSTKEIMDDIQARCARLVVLDHHESVKDVVESMSEHVYDGNRSGAGIAWDYFFPDTPRPSLVNYLEDQDLWRHTFPETVPVHAYLESRPFTFEEWDQVAYTLEHDERESFLEKARTYAEYFELLAHMAADKARIVSFEGYECAFTTCHPFKSLKSRVGNLLAQAHPPIAIVVTAHPEGCGVSIRGDGSVDVSEIAARFGGGGHPNSSGFLIPNEGPYPWKLLRESIGHEE